MRKASRLGRSMKETDHVLHSLENGGLPRMYCRDSGREKPAFDGEEDAAAHHRQPAARAAYARANRPPGAEALGARHVEYTNEFEAKRG